jgi:hypothetical protein
MVKIIEINLEYQPLHKITTFPKNKPSGFSKVYGINAASKLTRVLKLLMFFVAKTPFSFFERRLCIKA